MKIFPFTSSKYKKKERVELLLLFQDFIVQLFFNREYLIFNREYLIFYRDYLIFYRDYLIFCRDYPMF